MTENPGLLRTPLTLPPNAPPNRKQALLTAPLLGLLRWCVKAPLIEVACAKMLKRLASEEAASSPSSTSSSSATKNASVAASARTQLTLTAVYSQLHLAVLNCFMTQMEETQQRAGGVAASASGAKPAMEPFSAEQMLQLAHELAALERQVRGVVVDINNSTQVRAGGHSPTPEITPATMVESAASNSESAETSAMEACVDRLAQAIQVAKATNALTTQPGDLDRIRTFLPRNALLSVVVAHWDP